MNDTEENAARPAGAMDRLKKLLVGLLVVALLAVAGYLQVERNHRTYFTNTRDGALVVLKGSYFLWGARPYLPDDPATAEVYAPIPLPADAEPIPGGRFDEREGLDRYLFDLLAGWAEPRIRSGEPERMKEGFLYVDRAGRLSGLSGSQAKKLRDLRAEVAYFEARDRIERAAELLEEARKQLLLATDGSSHARDAAALLDQIEPANQVIAYALRTVRLGAGAVEGVKPAYYPVPVTVVPPPASAAGANGAPVPAPPPAAPAAEVAPGAAGAAAQVAPPAVAPVPVPAPRTAVQPGAAGGSAAPPAAEGQGELAPRPAPRPVPPPGPKPAAEPVPAGD